MASKVDTKHPDYETGRRAGVRSRYNHERSGEVLDCSPLNPSGRSPEYLAGYDAGYSRQLKQGRPREIKVPLLRLGNPKTNRLREIQIQARYEWGDDWGRGLANAVSQNRTEDRPKCNPQSIQRTFLRGSCSDEFLAELEAVKFTKRKVSL
jgi:hypothetical protein